MQNDDVRALEALVNFVETKQTGVKQIRDIEPIESWLNSSYYVGAQANIFFSFWKDHLVDFERGRYSELLITGSEGGGKTDMAVMGLVRKVYLLSCFDYPQLKMGLGKGSSVILYYMGITIKQAKLAGFGRLIRYIDDCPYFTEHFPRNQKNDSMIEMPGKSVVGISGSDMGSFTGTDLLLAALDEQNFVEAGGGAVGVFQKAQDTYAAAARRIKGRYGANNEFAFLSLISSADTQSSFMETRINESKNDAAVKIIHATKYKIHPGLYSRTMFSMYIGDENCNPFVLEPEKKYEIKALLSGAGVEDVESYLDFSSYSDFRVPEAMEDRVARIPEDFIKDARLDPAGTLTAIAGISIHSVGKFFTDGPAFQECIDYDCRHPFSSEAITVSAKNPRNELIDAWDKNVRGIRGRTYYGHLDIGVSEDSGGMAMAHYEGDSKAHLDFMILINPPGRPDEIEIDKFRDFVRWLKYEQGFDISVFTSDQYQSKSTIQFFEKIKIRSFLYSMDAHDDYYEQAKSKILAHAVSFYPYPRFEFELFNLIHNRAAHKVDHPPQNGVHAKDGGFGNDVVGCVLASFNHVFTYARLEAEKSKQLKSIVAMRREAVITGGFKSEREILNYEEKLAVSKFNYNDDPFMANARKNRVPKFLGRRSAPEVQKEEKPPQT